jgi:hypothetical protein
MHHATGDRRTVFSFESLVSTYEFTQRYNPEEQNVNFSKRCFRLGITDFGKNPEIQSSFVSCPSTTDCTEEIEQKRERKRSFSESTKCGHNSE